MLGIPVGALEATVAKQALEAVTTGLTDVASNIGSSIVSLVPIALGVVGAVMAVLFGVKFFRKLVK